MWTLIGTLLGSILGGGGKQKPQPLQPVNPLAGNQPQQPSGINTMLASMNQKLSAPQTTMQGTPQLTQLQKMLQGGY